MLCLFNWDDAPQTLTVRLPDASAVTDFWTGEALAPARGCHARSRWRRDRRGCSR